MKFNIGDCVEARNWAGDLFLGIIIDSVQHQYYMDPTKYFVKFGPTQSMWFTEYLVSPVPPEQWHEIRLKVYGMVTRFNIGDCVEVSSGGLRPSAIGLQQMMTASGQVWFAEFYVYPVSPEQWHEIRLKVFGNEIN